MLGKLRPLVGSEQTLNLYQSLILPVLDYADVIYDCLSAKDSPELQKWQNCALRIVQHADRLTSTKTLHENSKILYLSDRRHAHSCTQMYKVANKLCPSTISDKFVQAGAHHDRVTRAVTRNDIVLPEVRLEISRKNFTYRGPYFWSFVYEDLKLCPSLLSFKRNLLASDLFLPT